jgi:hypothetical protein
MISDLLSPTTDQAAKPEPRLAMRPGPVSRGHVDGAWWPRSADPASEFPALITAMSARGDQVRRVSYNLDSWDHCARRMSVGGEQVRMEGFHTLQANTVMLIGPTRTRIRLAVVPPGTPAGAARAALRAASTPDGIATVEQILTWNGIPADGARDAAVVASASVPRPRGGEPEPQERWEAEGGAMATSTRELHKGQTR